MRSTSTILGVVVAVTASLAVVMFQSCQKGGGGGDSDTSDNTTQQTTVVTDAAAPAAATLADGSGVTLPAGVLAVGGTVSVEVVAAPDEFAVAEVSSASTPVKLAASNADGTAIDELSQAGTVAIAITPAAALVAVEPVDANLCALGLAVNGTKLVWRRGVLSEVTPTTAKFLTKLLGTFQLAYCGTTTLDGFVEMNGDGTQQSAAATFLSGRGACHYEELNCCSLKVGKDLNVSSAKAACTGDGAWKTDGCLIEDVVGYCIYKKGTTEETADVLYTGSETTKQICESSDGVYATTYTPTAATKQVKPTTYVCQHVPLQGGCNTEYSCNMYYGQTATELQDTKDMCADELSGEWVAACPTTNLIGCCLSYVYQSTTQEIVKLMTTTHQADQSAAVMECSDGDFYTPAGVFVEGAIPGGPQHGDLADVEF